ncbi:MAG: histidine phosphatase family protein [Nitrospirae bacterium]|nr:histidine phosphatase family protein [Nitrospirota bacterium]
MVTTLYLVRHGETEGSETKRYKGSIDVPLSEKGIEQMKGSSAFIKEHLWNSSSSKHMSYLKDIHATSDAFAKARKCESSGSPSGLSAVYTSNLSRAVKSAEIIAEPYEVQPLETPAFRERSFGIWEGMTFSEIKEKYPAEFEAWAGNPLRYSPIEGESTLEVKERVIPALEKILENHAGENIAVVAHGGVNRIMLCHVLGIPLENIFRIEQDYAAVNIIEFWDRYPVVKLINGRLDI